AQGLEFERRCVRRLAPGCRRGGGRVRRRVVGGAIGLLGELLLFRALERIEQQAHCGALPDAGCPCTFVLQGIPVLRASLSRLSSACSTHGKGLRVSLKKLLS